MSQSNIPKAEIGFRAGGEEHWFPTTSAMFSSLINGIVEVEDVNVQDRDVYLRELVGAGLDPERWTEIHQEAYRAYPRAQREHYTSIYGHGILHPSPAFRLAVASSSVGFL